MSKQRKKSQRKKGSAPKPIKKKVALEINEVEDAPVLHPNEDVALGTLSGPSEATLSDHPQRSDKKKREGEKQDVVDDESSSTPTAADAQAGVTPELPPLRLPRGGFLAFRKSGGLLFSSREVVVYPDGRVAYDARGVPQKEYNRLRRALNDGQVGALRHLLDQTGFWKEQGGGEQNPDAFAYEIAARLGQRSNEVQLFDGSMPDRLQPLVEQLVKLLPE